MSFSRSIPLWINECRWPESEVRGMPGRFSLSAVREPGICRAEVRSADVQRSSLDVNVPEGEALPEQVFPRGSLSLRERHGV